MILPVTLVMAAACGLLNLWLGLRVARMRRAHQVSIGDGGAQPLVARMRAQANFVEYTPFVLILIGAIELTRGSSAWLWAVGTLYLAARILHAFGMDRPPGNALRKAGIWITLIVLVGLALYALAIVATAKKPQPGITYAAQLRAST